MLDEHVYYWAWTEYDNPKHDYRGGTNNLLFRVFRVVPKMGTKDVVLTEAMSKVEAIAYCKRIVKLTGGREI